MGGGIDKSAVRINAQVFTKLGIDLDRLADLRPRPMEVTGGSVVLRPLTQQDEDARRDLVAQNREDLLAGGLIDEDDDGDVLASMVTSEVLDLSHCFGIFREGQLIGEAALTGVVRQNRQSAYLSLWLDTDARGDGVAEQAFVLLVGHGMEQLSLHRIEVTVLPENKAVARALEKVGLDPIGTDPSCVRVQGEWRDHVRYVFTADDWDARSAELRRQFV